VRHGFRPPRAKLSASVEHAAEDKAGRTPAPPFLTESHTLLKGYFVIISMTYVFISSSLLARHFIFPKQIGFAGAVIVA